MKGSHRNTSPNQPPGESQTQIDEARKLFETMVGEARRRSERESEAARSQGPVARSLLVLTIVAVVLAVSTLVYGLSRFPDAPIRPTAAGYTGKGGTARTQADFEAFAKWKTAMFTIFPLAFILGFGYAIASRQTNTPVRPAR